MMGDDSVRHVFNASDVGNAVADRDGSRFGETEANRSELPNVVRWSSLWASTMAPFLAAFPSISRILDCLPMRPKLAGFAVGDVVAWRDQMWKVEEVGATKLYCSQKTGDGIEQRSFAPEEVRKLSWSEQMSLGAEAARDPRERLMDSITKGKLPRDGFK